MSKVRFFFLPWLSCFRFLSVLKKIGVSGIVLTIAGFSFITLAGFFDTRIAIKFIVCGIILFSIGISALLSGWFALLSPLIPEAIEDLFSRPCVFPGKFLPLAVLLSSPLFWNKVHPLKPISLF